MNLASTDMGPPGRIAELGRAGNSSESPGVSRRLCGQTGTLVGV